MNSEYRTMLHVAAECELLSRLADDRSIREKSAELAKEYRARAERLKSEQSPTLG